MLNCAVVCSADPCTFHHNWPVCKNRSLQEYDTMIQDTMAMFISIYRNLALQLKKHYTADAISGIRLHHACVLLITMVGSLGTFTKGAYCLTGITWRVAWGPYKVKELNFRLKALQTHPMVWSSEAARHVQLSGRMASARTKCGWWPYKDFFRVPAFKSQTLHKLWIWAHIMNISAYYEYKHHRGARLWFTVLWPKDSPFPLKM